MRPLRRAGRPLAAALCVAAFAAAGQEPAAGPPGANDWQCRPAAAHPRPVILVHGTYANMAQNWSALAPLLQRRGWCVYALDYGANGYGDGTMFGMGPMAQSARELAAFVDRVLRATGAAQVDLVGHSQGGLLPRYYLKVLGGARRVNALVGIAPANHGTDSWGLAGYAAQMPWMTDLLLASWCPACAEQLRGSAFLKQLNAGGETVPGVRYTVIASRRDDVVTPFESQLLEGSGVANLVIQDLCPQHRVLHEELAFDPVVLQLVVNALDPPQAAPVVCERRSLE